LNYCVCVCGNGDGMIVYIGEDENMEFITRMSLYTQCSLEVELRNEIAKYNGNIVRFVALEEGALLFIQPYPMEIMQSTQMGALTCEKGVHPFKLMDFLVNNADSDVNGLRYPGIDNRKIEDYLIVGIIRNLQVNIEDLVIGAVRFGEEINTSDNFMKDYSNVIGDKTLVWVNVKEESLFKAFEKGKQLLNSACDFITLALKNDVFIDWYGTSEKEKTVWDIKSHTPNIFIDTLFYVENCSLGDAITFRDNNMLTPNAVQLDDHTGYLFDEDWIELFFRKIHDSDEKILRLQHAIKWIVQAWRAKDKYDKLIYCSTALEFIVNGEKGYNIFNEYALKEKRKEFTQKEKNDLIADIVNKINIESIEGFSPEGIEALNNSISSMIGAKLSEYSFNSKLDMLIKRLDIPVSDEEKQLLKNARDARNKLIHGREMCYISTLDVKRLCGITSRVLIYKIIEKTKE